MHQRQAERRQRRRDLRCRENGHLGTLSFSRQVLGWRSELSITERSLLRVMPIILFWVRGSRQGTWDYVRFHGKSEGTHVLRINRAKRLALTVKVESVSLGKMKTSQGSRSVH
jgi:hypothetical protein